MAKVRMRIIEERSGRHEYSGGNNGNPWEGLITMALIFGGFLLLGILGSIFGQ